MIQSSACRWQTHRPGVAGARARPASYTTPRDTIFDLMCGIWVTVLVEWQKGRAIGCLLTQLVASRPDDWMAVLDLLDAELGEQAKRSDHLAARGHDYLVGWIKGHFYNLNDVRSRDKVVTEIRTARRSKAANPSKRRRRRRWAPSSMARTRASVLRIRSLCPRRRYGMCH